MKTNYTAYGKTYLVGRTVSIPNIKWYLDHAVTLQFQIYSLVLEQTDYSSISTSRSWGKEGGANSVKIFLFSFSVKGFIWKKSWTSLSPEQELIWVLERLIWVYCLNQVTLRNQHSKMLMLNSDLIEQLLQVNRSWNSSALCSTVLHVHNRLGSTRAFFIKQCLHLQLDAAYNCIILILEYKHISLQFCDLKVCGTGINIIIWLFFQP